MKQPFVRIPIMAIATLMALSLAQAQAAVWHGDTDAKWGASVKSHQGAGIDRFIVTYRPDSSEALDQQAVLQNVSAAVGRAGLDQPAGRTRGRAQPRLSARYVRRLALGSDVIGVSRALDDTQARRLMRAIATDPAVLHVEPDLRLYATQRPAHLASPRTFALGDQLPRALRWNYNDPRGGANIEKAWELADGKDVVVAVLDTGITQHPGLDLSLADAGYDFISDAGTSGRAVDGRAAGGWDPGDWSHTPDYEICFDGPGGEPSSWHGTKVAGIVAGLAGNPDGVEGVAHRAKVLSVRVAGHCGAGYLSDLTDAILWAAGAHVKGVPDNTHPAQVINVGVGDRFDDGCTETFSLQGAIAEANRRGAVVIAPAGNFDGDVALAVPASCPGVIAVAANDITGARATGSSFGAEVALAAPGGGAADGTAHGFIWSLSNQGATVPTQPGYAASTGTGMAAAHVAGVAALMISAVKQAGSPALTPEQIRQRLTGAARTFPAATDQPMGAGILDAYAAVLKALNGEAQVEPVIQLQRGVLQPGQSISEGESLLYAIEVPEGARYLNLRTLGGTGDAALYAKSGAAPAIDGTDADASSDQPGNNEAIIRPRPPAGTWYLRVRARQSVGKLAVLANYSL